MDLTESASAMPGVMFREIHKNGCLKKYCSERRTGFPRRTDRVWVVFCVHDDTEAFLEFYPDNKVALSHKPEWFVSLHNALHVSPSICGQVDEFEFAVTLPTQVVRLGAASWDAMMEWVETIRNKLRELRILAPKENLYSKMPEPRHALLPTRDPTSPLPLPPAGAFGVVPGVESPLRSVVLPSGDDLPEPAITNEADNTSSSVETEVELVSKIEETFQSDLSSSSRVPKKEDVHLVRPRCELTSQPGPSQPHRTSVRQTIQLSDSSNKEVECQKKMNGNRRKHDVHLQQSGSSVVLLSNDSVASLTNSGSPIRDEDGRQPHALTCPSGNNVTVIEVPPPPTSPHYEHLFTPACVPSQSDSHAKLEQVNCAGLIPRVPARVLRDSASRPTSSESPSSARINRANQISERVDISPHHVSSVISVQAAINKEPPKTTTVKVLPGEGVSVVAVQSPGPSTITQVNATVGTNCDNAIPPIPAAFQPAPSNLNIRDIPLIGGHQRRRRRSSSTDVGPTQRGLGGADLIRVVSAEAPEAPETPANAPRRTLRETQVCQLLREMTHPGGVRLPLRRKDCFGAIALVDISNAVWVAGWKQKEHPMLYNALHIGDRLVSVGDIHVRSAAEAQKLLRGGVGPSVELVVKRLPLGRVLSLQRPRGGGDIGLVPDMTNPGEVSVTPCGVAALNGLPSYTTSMDGLTLTSWTLTEINGRPLNLFCKPTDVTTRLNSVGKELSVLVQPSDFIKQLRKQLKSLKGFKEYLLQ